MLFSRWPMYDRVLINLVDGSAISGLLVAQRGPLLILTDATLFTASAEPAALDGDVYVERERVLYMQTAPARDS